MIRHDLEWFASKGLTDAPMIAIEYAEHLMRWRPITELPSDGEYIQIAGELFSGNLITRIKVYDPLNSFLGTDISYYGWRPAPIDDLPTNAGE